MIEIVCIYHKNCSDGFAAAWAVGMFYGFDAVTFIAADYDDPIPDLRGKTVFIVDFSYPPAQLLEAIKESAQVTLIDHHKTAVDAWDAYGVHNAPSNLTLVLDKKHSGAVLTWKHFNPNGHVPYLYRVLEDYDLYAWKVPHSRAIVAALYARGYAGNESWHEFAAVLEKDEDIGDIIREGEVVLRVNRQLVDSIIKRNMTLIEFMGFTVPLTNVPKEHASLAGELLSKSYPFAITYDDWHASGIRKFSLRSRKDGGEDVEKLAKLLGGGGHVNAAGFSVSLQADLGGYIQFL